MTGHRAHHGREGESEERNKALQLERRRAGGETGPGRDRAKARRLERGFRNPREALVEKNWGLRTIIAGRAQDSHENTSEALHEARAKPCLPRGDIHAGCRRGHSQVPASGTRVLGKTQKKAIQAEGVDWFR